jgi:hypothetical protein
VLLPTSPIPSSATVHCLIDEDTKTWNQETVHAFFDEAAAEQILNILISRHEDGDFACWPFTRHVHAVYGLPTILLSFGKIHYSS